MLEFSYEFSKEVPNGAADEPHPAEPGLPERSECEAVGANDRS